ncbi:hypothetical protein DFH08DRAFT_801210 [Mycena albidolilacea]|uniref:Uncharacterized protein n=1 Tax=Mycena albidolilacea TaxID=1033008 RepID=A0AAD7AI37_9AGAR|nr:hypothetical protein DFH08DRAFT_801210 [Mycena albidolilacea]
MSAPESEAEFQQLLQLLKDSQSTSYVTIAALTVLVYIFLKASALADPLLCLDQQVEYMWCSNKWSLAKGLYIWVKLDAVCQMMQLMSCRIGILALPPCYSKHFSISTQWYPTICRVFIQVEGLAATIIVGTVDIVLLLRVYVLYGNSKKMLIFLIPLVLCEVILIPLLGCYAFSVPRFLTLYAIPALAVVQYLLASFIQAIHIMATVIHNTNIISEMPLIRLFAQDGIIWFIAVLHIHYKHRYHSWAVGRPTLAEVNIAMSCTLYSIIASRVLLNTKMTLMKTDNLTTLTLQNGEMELQFMGTADTDMTGPGNL